MFRGGDFVIDSPKGRIHVGNRDGLTQSRKATATLPSRYGGSAPGTSVGIPKTHVGVGRLCVFAALRETYRQMTLSGGQHNIAILQGTIRRLEQKPGTVRDARERFPLPYRPRMDIDRAIRERHTLKILGDDNAPLPPPPDEFADTMVVIMEAAACAPCHYTCHASHQRTDSDSTLPWRLHALHGASCRRLMERVAKAEPGGKVAKMLAVANGLILVTWLPDPPSVVTDPPQLFEPTRRNMEHIAATAAAIQNMLLTATAAGVHTFWSSGGLLRDQPMLDSLAVPPEQVLLGAVYLFPSEVPSATTKPGALRGRQGERGQWMRWVSI